MAPKGEKESKGFTADALAVVGGLALPEISNNRQNHLANFTAINKGQSRCSNNHAGNESVKELHKHVSIGQSPQEKGGDGTGDSPNNNTYSTVCIRQENLSMLSPAPALPR